MFADPKNRKEKINKKKKLEELLKHGSFILLFLLFAFLIVSTGPQELSLSRITGLVSFNSSPDFNDADIYTNENLSCEWGNSSDTLNITVVWLNGSTTFDTIVGNITNITSPQILSSSNTQKGETWFCRVSLFNVTDNITEEVNVTISNSMPSNLKMYYQSTEVGSSFSLYEDTLYNFILNATDLDNDTLNYSVNSLFDPLGLCSVNPASGATVCNVSHDDLLVGGNETITYQNRTQFEASDNDEGGSPNKLVDFTLIPVNDAPVISLVNADYDIDVDTNYTQEISVIDEENNSYNLSVVNNDLNGPESLSYLKLNETTLELYFNTTDGTCAVADFGNYSVNITTVDVDDSSVNTTYVFNLTIASTNHAPNLTDVTAQIIGVQGQPFTLSVHATDIDVGTGENLTFSTDKTSFNSFTNLLNYTVNDTLHFNATLNISNITNQNIIDRDFIIYVTDQFFAQDNISINAVLNNTNDIPVINDNSSYSGNTFGWAQNISNVTAYYYTHFTYIINGSDIDNLTYEEENLSYTMNYSGNYFNLSSNGVFTFYTENESLIGNTYLFNITLSDDGSENFIAGIPLTASKTLSLTVLNNSLPYFVYSLENISCSEDSECYFNITGNDSDPGDYVNYSIESISVIDSFGNSSFTFNISQSDGIINFTPNQSRIGNYEVNISLLDQRGAVIYDNFNISINNTNDVPELIKPIVFPSDIYFGIPYSSLTLVEADDEDLYLTNSGEVLDYSFNITPSSPDVLSINSSSGNVEINTSMTDCSNKTYNVTIIVYDSSGANDTYDTNFTINDRSDPPEIQSVYPYGNASNNYEIVYGWNATNQTSGGTTIFAEDENTSIVFNHSTVDLDSNLTYNWSIDGSVITDSSLIEGNHTLNYSFDFFDEENHQILLVVSDDTKNSVNWTWDFNITNVNRPPTLNNSLTNFTGNRSIDGSIMVTNYFTLPSSSSGLQRFYDPDFDTNEDKLLNNEEVSNLTYEYTSGCNAYVNILILGDSITLTGLQEGSCSVIFTAEDSDGASAISNTVYLNVTAEYEEPDTPSGGTTRNTVTLPFESEDDGPIPLQIITAKSVVIYQNQTMVVPIELKNNWTGPLNQINVYVTTEEEDIEFNLSENYFGILPRFESEFLNLTLINYREPGAYEMNIHANVSDPDFRDSALITVNSLEEKHKGETLETKLAFARDLLDNNGECQELLELLQKAEDTLKEGNQEMTAKFLDVAINGCKYIISEYNKEILSQEPGTINLKLNRDFFKDLLNNRNLLIYVGIFVLIMVIVLLFIRKVIAKKSEKNNNDFNNIDAEHKFLLKKEKSNK